jgi:hypothetical protein
MMEGKHDNCETEEIWGKYTANERMRQRDERNAKILQNMRARR